jgi:hypothetical protein
MGRIWIALCAIIVLGLMVGSLWADRQLPPSLTRLGSVAAEAPAPKPVPAAVVHKPKRSEAF